MSEPDPTPANETNDEKLDSHVYDGIQEYDNPIPGWWKWLFIATILFTPLYILWFHAPNMGRDILADYDRDYAANLERQFGELGELDASSETILRYVSDEKWLAVGRTTYQANCSNCHGSDGGGSAGPNLTDNAFLHITEPADIATILEQGAAEGAMPAWGNRLHPNALVLTASYVASLRGQNVAGGKAPEGNEIPSWEMP